MDLGKTQIISLGAKAVTTALGIIQSVVVIRILGPEDFGLVGLVISIGSVVGVSQHLGVVEGTIREMAVRKNKEEMGKVFWASHAVRQLMTVPLSVALLVLAGWIAGGIYGKPEIATYLQLFAGILVLQGLQDVMGSVLTGRKLFFPLYAIQIVTAAINVVVFSWLTWQWRIAGFFAAMVLTTLIMVALLGVSVWRDLKGHLAWPDLPDIKKYGSKVLKIGVFMYLARIFFVVWQRLPIVLLGGILPASELGYLNVSQTFGSKLTIVAMALAEVNMAWMSTMYVRERKNFEETVARNMRRVLLVMVAMAATLLFFTPEIIKYIIGSEYLPAQNLILVMTVGFFLYALTDIGTSSVFVPANNPKLRTLVYAAMVAITAAAIGIMMGGSPAALPAAWAVTGGAAAAYILMAYVAKLQFRINLIDKKAAAMVLLLASSLGWLLSGPPLAGRAAVFGLLMAFLWQSTVGQKFRRKREAARNGVENKQEGCLIVCFAGAPYDSMSWTNRQQIMSRMSKDYRVLYVEPRIWIARAVFRNWRRPEVIWKFLNKIWGLEKKKDNLWIKSQCNLLPGSRELAWVSNLNQTFNRGRVMRAVKMLRGKGKLVMWIYDTEAAQYLDEFAGDQVIYDCVDDHAAQAGVDRNPSRVREEEEKIMKRADLVTVTSRALYEEKAGSNANTQLVLNVGDVDLFRKNAGRKEKSGLGLVGPTLGMVGAMDDYKIDFEMIERLAVRRPDWNFVLIGRPVVGSKKLNQLKRLKNVYARGEAARKKVPALVDSFDLCLIPYRESRYNAASFPLKFWEFMATGKPIVVRGLPELKEYDGLIGYAESEADFERLCERWLQQPEEGRDQRVRLAAPHGWRQRKEKLEELMLKLVHNDE